MTVAQTRTHLLDTALDLIWQSNYNAVGVNEICKKAGVTKGSFYHHFESKAELFCEATDYYWEKIRGDLDGLLSPVNTPLEQLHKWINYLFEKKIGNDPEHMPGCPFFTASQQSGCGETRIMASMQSMVNRADKYNLALINNLRNGGYLDDNLDTEQVSRLLQHYIHGALNHARLIQDLANIRRDLPLGVYRIIGLKAEFWPEHTSL